MSYELPGSVTSTLSLMPATTSEVARFSYLLTKAVKEGDANALQTIVQLHALTKVHELVKDEIIENIMTEVDKYPEKKFSAYGCMIEKAENGVKYLYEKCGDSEWEQLDAEIKGLEERKKAREAFLRALKEPTGILNQSTGEIEMVQPPPKMSTSGIKIHLASK